TRKRCSSGGFGVSGVTRGGRRAPPCGVQALWTLGRLSRARVRVEPARGPGGGGAQRRVRRMAEAPGRSPRGLGPPTPIGCRGLLVLGDVEVRELLREARVRAARADVLEGRDVLVERRPEAAQAVAVAEPELRGDLVLVEQADLVHRAGERLRGL